MALILNSLVKDFLDDWGTIGRVFGGGFEIPATCYVYGATVDKLHIIKVINNADPEQR